MNVRQTLVGFIGGLTLAFAAERAVGYPVTWQFAGEITTVADPTGVLDGAVTVGSPFSGSFTFESTAPDSEPDDNMRAFYLDAITSVSGQVGGLAFLGPVGSLNLVSVLNDVSDNDQYGIRAEVELLGEQPVLRLRLFDSTATMFSDDSLPLFPPDLGSLDTARVDMFLESDTIPFAFGADLIVFVPEPATLSLLGVAALALLRGRGPRRPIRTGERR